MEIRSLDAEIVTRAAKKGEREIVSFVASTASPDRYGDVINQRGWSLAKFRKNPVILLNHNATSQLPIGRGDVEIVDGKLMVDVEFDMGDPVAAEVARKTKAGFMSAVSVGFNAIESTPRSSLSKDNPYYAKSGYFFDKAELLEISIVTIPANGEAVAAKNFTPNNRLFKLSKLKHVIDVEYDGDHVIVTYLLKRDEEEREQEEEEIEEMQEQIDEEIEMEAEEEEAYGYDDEDSDEDKEKNFLTNQERDLFALITTNGE